ncbi:hypothetical protein O181_094224 [Austropuccinia psidii MF-1]|uniref:Uncharacterized protein n=1 Tax=Austropuccinia psidii MF-1 TaxID=1389203 RepID=A0A9Q3PAM0_9BASI|nr:hypothetical protein [Austropuccinia psidii MF-1]
MLVLLQPPIDMCPPPPHVHTQPSLSFHMPTSFFLLLTFLLNLIDMCPPLEPHVLPRPSLCFDTPASFSLLFAMIKLPQHTKHMTPPPHPLPMLSSTYHAYTARKIQNISLQPQMPFCAPAKSPPLLEHLVTGALQSEEGLEISKLGLTYGRRKTHLRV